MKRLPLMDAAWLTMESAATPMHVGCLQLFRPPPDAPEDYLQRLHAWLTSVESPEPPFNRKLAFPLKGLKQPHWVEDEDFDIHYHVRHSALPRPGRIRELFVLVSRLHGTLLDRTRPLWECHLIEGLADGRFALYTKIHHSVVDGVAGIRLMQSSLATDPADTDRPPPWGIRRQRRASAAAGPTAPASSVLGQLASAARGTAGLLGAARESLRLLTGRERAAPYRAPKSILNRPISPSRRFAAQSWPLSRIRALGKARGATVNDVVLAMCAGALRRYLLDLDALPAQPLIADIPVSVRPADAGEEGGNAISVILVDLASDEPDPLARLARIRDSVAAGKQRLAGMSREQIQQFTTLIMAPFTIGQLIGTAGRLRPMFNLVVSNVPGPREQLYLHGAALEGMYPVSLLFNGQALNVTVTSYRDSLDFGLIACRRSLPHMQRLLDHLEAALAELEAATGSA